MLKRLELVGFKSFADRTWFTFPPGLTAVVGPNGSGKSNVVDAVKWILGEQSAKSLRGGEMADVIFNGSSSRKALGVAEVTLTLDNSRRELNLDAAEVAVTRRVHRDGTGEYLINGQASRLRDVRELFLGSGAGSTHYCIIEQGRVDAVLQASPRDRRAIFEEAAGISRFKAKKIEALRKLEHTAENLTRLRDIQSEVEARLRRVRLDAEKARKYQEYSGRLRDLRLGIGLSEYHSLTLQLHDESDRLEQLRRDMIAAQSQVAAGEGEAKQLESSLASAEAEIARGTEILSDIRGRVATFQERFVNEETKAGEVETELAAARLRAVELVELIRGLESAADRARHEVAAADAEAADRRARVADLDAAAADTEQELTALRNLVHDGRDRQFQLVGRAAALNSEAIATRKQLDKLSRELDRKRREGDAKAARLATVGRVLDALGRKDFDLQNRLAVARQSLADRRKERTNLRSQAERQAEALEALRVRRSGLTGRMEVLENLERTQEGLGTGVREVLAELADRTGPLCSAVIALVADSLRVPRELAPLIDIALGEVTSHFVVRDAAAIDDALAARSRAFSGRVSFLAVTDSDSPVLGAGIVTADQWVTCERPELTGLPRQLLGRTIVVEDVPTARRMAADREFAGYRFITRSGELIDSNGALTVGRHRAESGIVSRKSELRELRSQAAELDAQVAQAERRLTELREQVEGLAVPIHGLEEEIRALSSHASGVKTEMLKQTQQRDRLRDEITLICREREALEKETGRLETLWKETRASAEDAERQADQLKHQIETAEAAVGSYERDRAVRQQEQTSARVALAETVQRLNGLREAYQKLAEDLDRGRTEADRMGRHQTVLASRRVECELTALRTSADLAEAFRLKDVEERRMGEWILRREAERARRGQLLESLATGRSDSQALLEKFHGRELAARDLATARDRVADRLRDEYQIDLAAEYATSPLSRGEEKPWDAAGAAKEAEDLRKKIRHLGNISLEALAELSDVEGRANNLQAQIDDLTAAENSLRAVINKINEDSQRLFTETYETVRAHFQELFRKLFGGGMADIVLDTPADVLETGVDIVARPPGKELRGISLMSGGEKTLTAVALLLAIFRSKPSPFCLLDEVDAALDEANTERLAQTIRDFTDRSQFIVVTHKKRTMAYADLLYGITMQESGVSKQIGVRFEDWPEEQARAHAA